MSEPILTPSPEVVKEPVLTETKDDFTSNFEKITKQEKHNSEIRRQLETNRKAFETDKAELERYRQFDKELKNDPLSVLEKLGLPLSRIHQLAQEKQTPQNPEARRAIELATRLEQELKQRDEKEKQEKLSREDIRLNASIAETVKSGGYDIIEHLGLESSVRDFMEQYYEETGEIPDIKTACEAVAADIVTKLNKVKGSKFLQPKEEESLVTKQVSEVPKTITNKMSQSSEKVSRTMSETERMKEAVRLMNLK